MPLHHADGNFRQDPTHYYDGINSMAICRLCNSSWPFWNNVRQGIVNCFLGQSQVQLPKAYRKMFCLLNRHLKGCYLLGYIIYPHALKSFNFPFLQTEPLFKRKGISPPSRDNSRDRGYSDISFFRNSIKMADTNSKQILDSFRLLK